MADSFESLIQSAQIQRQRKEDCRMKRRAHDCFVVAFFLLFSSVLAYAGEQTKSANNCDIQNGPCNQEVANGKITLDISPKPVTAMHDLVFRVTCDPPVKVSDGASIDLNMPAMNMGRNRVVLKPVGEGVYEGRGVIVRCKSGDRTWRAQVNFPGMGSASFIFDVVY